MSGIFEKCISLVDINVSNFNTQNVINMENMFSLCTYLTKIDLSIYNKKM